MPTTQAEHGDDGHAGAAEQLVEDDVEDGADDAAVVLDGVDVERVRRRRVRSEAELAAPECEQHGEREDDEARPERPHVGQARAGEQQAAERAGDERQEHRGPAEEDVQARDDATADEAAVPAEPEHDGEEDRHRDEPEPGELVVLVLPARGPTARAPRAAAGLGFGRAREVRFTGAMQRSSRATPGSCRRPRVRRRARAGRRRRRTGSLGGRTGRPRATPGRAPTRSGPRPPGPRAPVRARPARGMPARPDEAPRQTPARRRTGSHSSSSAAPGCPYQGRPSAISLSSSSR